MQCVIAAIASATSVVAVVECLVEAAVSVKAQTVISWKT
jgi:hypothetical protein